MIIDRHPSAVPGDVVRDQKTKTDYIIHGLETLAGAGLVSYVLIDVFTRKMREEIVEEAAFRREFMTLLPNTQKLPPSEVLSQLQAMMREGLKDDTLYETLAQPENAALRDLLYISANVNEGTFADGIIHFAQSTVQLLGGRPSKQAVFQTLRQSVDPNTATDEFIMSIAERVFNIQQFAGYHLSSPISLSPEQNTASVKFMGSSQYKWARETGLIGFRQGADKDLSNNEAKFIRQVLGGTVEGRHLFGGSPLFAGIPDTDTIKERQALIAEELYKYMMGEPHLHPVLKEVIRREIPKAMRLTAESKSSPLTSVLLKSMRAEEASNNIIFRGPGLHFAPGTTEVQKMYARSLMGSRVEREIKHGINFPSARGTSKAIIPRRDHMHFNGRYSSIDWNAVGKSLDNKRHRSRLVSVTNEHFLSELIGERGFKLRADGEIMHLADAEHRQSLLTHLGVGKWNTTDSVLMKGKTLQTLLAQRAENMPLTLEVLRHGGRDSSHYLHDNLQAEDLAFIRGAHYSERGSRSHGDKSPVHFFDMSASHNAGLRKIGPLSEDTLDVHATIEKHLQLSPGKDMTRFFSVKSDVGDVHESTSLAELFAHINNNHKQYTRSVGTIMYRDERGAASAAGVRLSTQHGGFKPIAAVPSDINTRTPESLLVALKSIKGSTLQIERRIDPSQAAMQGAVSGRAAYNLAVVNITTNSREVESKLIGTNLQGATVQGQLDLIKKFYYQGGVIVDLESRLQNPRNPASWHLADMAWGTSVHDIVSKRGLTSYVKRAQAIIDFGETVAHTEVIASQGKYDPEQLLSFIQQLMGNKSVRAAGLEGKLQEAASHIKLALSDQRWLDLTVLHAMRPGETMAKTNQAYVQAKFLTGKDKVQVHGATPDVRHAWMTTNQARDGVLPAVENSTVHVGNAVLEAGMMVTESDPMGYNYGRVLAVKGLHAQEHVHELGGPGFIASVQSMGFDGVHGAPYEVSASSPHALASALSKRGLSVNAKDAEKLFPDYLASLNELSGRELREVFNPNRSKVNDILWSEGADQHLKAYGGSVARMRLIVRDMMRTDPTHELVESVDATGRRVRARVPIEGGGSSMLSRKVNELEKAAAAAGEHWDHIEGTRSAINNLVDEWLTSDAGQFMTRDRPEAAVQFMTKTLRKELFLAHVDPRHRALITDSEHSAYAQFLESKPMQMFTELFDGADDLKISHINAAQFLTHYSAMVYEEGTGARTVQNFGNRLSLRVGNEPVNIQYTREGAQGLDMLPARLLQKVGQENGEGASSNVLAEILHHTGSSLTVHDVNERMQTYARERGSDFANLEAWKTLTNDLVHSSDPLSHVVKAISTSEHGSHSIVVKAIQDKQRQLLEMGETEETLSKVAMSKDLVGRLTHLRQQHPTTPFQDLHAIAFMDWHKEHGEEGLKFFANMGEDVDYGQYSTNVELATRAKNEVHSLMHDDYLQGDFPLPSLLADDQRAGYLEGQELGLRGGAARSYERQYVLGRARATVREQIEHKPMQDTLKGELHAAVTQAQTAGQGQGNAQARSARSAVHELMTNSNILRTMTVPMAAAGGILALMAARTPTDDGFAMGKMQQGQAVGQPHAARYSEIPGDSKSRTVWDGDATPFQMDITFEGFVRRKEEKDALERHVFDTVSGYTQTRVRDTQVEDTRQMSFRQDARRWLRGNL